MNADRMVDFGWLSFLAQPWFVIPWYVIGIAGAIWVVHDMYTANMHVNEAVKWAWPIIVFFFSVIGLAFYLGTSRLPRIGEVEGDEAMERYNDYVSSMFRKVTGSVIHCVGGDGLGIISAMSSPASSV
jgi:hypothetical protein